MNRIGTYLRSITKTARTVIVGLAVVFVSAGIAQAATTISTDIQTDGALSVTSQTTLGNASSTLFTAYKGYFGTSATSTLGADGSLTLVAGLSGTSGSFSTTLGVTGLSSLGHASTTMLSVTGPAYFGGNAATSSFASDGSLTLSTGGTLSVTAKTTLGNASTTGPVSVASNFMVNGNATTTTAGALSMQSTLTVGASGNAVNNIIAGYCVATPVAMIASTTGVYADCTPYTSAGVAITSLTAGTGSGASRVFLMATSSLPAWVVIQSASTTGASTINVRLVNTSTTTVTAGSIPYSFNFWSFQ